MEELMEGYEMDPPMPESPGLPIEQEQEHPDENTSRLYHLKIPFCPYINWEATAKKIFEPAPAKCLVMAEHLNKATGHVHLQGYTKRSERSLKKIREDIHSNHSLMQEFKRKRARDPVYAAAHKRIKISTELKNEPTETGFQYCCKEVNVPLYSQGFTDEELKYLHENSNAYVKAKKEAVHDILEEAFEKGLLTYPDPKFTGFDDKMNILVQKARYVVVEARLKSGTRISSRYFKEDILNALVTNRRAQKEHKFHVAQLF